jgi:RNA polymerase sigma factor (sigma-70 family)
MQRGVVIGLNAYLVQLGRSVLGARAVRKDENGVVDPWEVRRQLLGADSVQCAEVRAVVVLQGQDHPEHFYSLLRLLGVPATVFVDGAVDVAEHGSTAAEIGRALGVAEPIVLQEPVPTTAAIHDFATHFRMGASPAPSRRPTGVGPRPGLISHETFGDEIHFIADHVRARPKASIAVVVAYADLVTRYRRALAQALDRHVQWHLSREVVPRDEQIDCGSPGAKVLTWASGPWLEFDTVVFAGLDLVGAPPPFAGVQSALRALATTARHDVLLSFSGHGEPALLGCLPTDFVEDRSPRLFVTGPPPPLQPVRPTRLSGSGHVLGHDKSAVEAARQLLRRDLSSAGRSRRHRVLTAEQERGLAQLMRGEHGTLSDELPRGFRARLSDRDIRAAAFDAMVAHNEGLVWSNVGSFRGEGLEDDDLFQYGVLGLMRAIEKFDPTLGTKFSTYATSWIRQQMSRGVADDGQLIRLPVHVHELTRKIRRTRDRLGENGRPVPIAAISRACEVPPDKVVQCLRLSAGVASLDAPVGYDSDLLLADLISVPQDQPSDPVDVLDREAAIELVQQALAGLKDRESEILRLRFGFDADNGLTLDEIGRKFGLSRERIRQIESTTKTKLRSRLVDGDLTTNRSAGDGRTGARAGMTGNEPRVSVRFRRADRDLASGSGLLRALRSHRRPLSVRGLALSFVDHCLDSGTRRISMRHHGSGISSQLVLVDDGNMPITRALLATFSGAATGSPTDGSSTPKAVEFLGTGLRLFDELLAWIRTERDKNGSCLALTHAYRTGLWWLTEGVGPLPPDIASDIASDQVSVVLLRAARHADVRHMGAAMESLHSELGLVLVEQLESRRLTLTLDGRVVEPRDPFLRHNPRAQDLGTERVSAGNHSAWVNPRVLPHPAALREEDRRQVDDPATWSATQGFYVRCNGRYLSCGGWLGLDGLDRTPETALARVAVEITPDEVDAWGLDRQDEDPSPPEPLRRRLAALAALARRRSEQVFAGQPVTTRRNREA